LLYITWPGPIAGGGEAWEEPERREACPRTSSSNDWMDALRRSEPFRRHFSHTLLSSCVEDGIRLLHPLYS